MDVVRVVAGCRLIAANRRTIRPASPAELARRLNPRFRVTPTIRLLSDIAVASVRGHDRRDIVNTPPRTGKSETLAVWTPVWALSEDPDLQVVIISNGDDLAQEHSRKVREIVREHSDVLGFRIAADKTAVGRWKVEGRAGGMLAAGINSHIVGFGADLMILDDVVGGAAEADSAAHRRRVLAEYQGSLSTRIHPGGSCLLVMTRWHEHDLAGALIAAEPDRWRVTNVPAVAEPGVADALGRGPGVAMVSALGFTPTDFRRRRTAVGERMWYAQYMGVPSAPAGGLVKQEWLDRHRVPVAPRNPVLTVVAVDPSDSGSGDSCGLLVVSLGSDGRVFVVADESAPMTSEQWSRAAVRLAVESGASEVVVEGFSARETYSRVMAEAIARERPGRRVGVSMWPPKGRTRVGDAVSRSAALLQALEVGSCVLAGRFPEFERRAVGWQSGQHQPDALAALVIGHDVLVRSAGQVWGLSSPADAGLGSVTELAGWMRQRLA